MAAVKAQPTVSVVLIFHNEERFLDEAVRSVVAQSFSDWELLLIDDGSTDASPQMARKWTEIEPARIRYLQHAGGLNLGMSASRNLGIRSAAGEYVTFLDADDAWLPNFLRDHVTALEAHPTAGMVFGPLNHWFGWTGRKEDEARDFFGRTGVDQTTVFSPPDLLPRFVLQNKNSITPPSGYLVRRQSAENVGGYEDSFRGLFEDQVFSAKISLHENVVVTTTPGYLYRQHAASCTQRATPAELLQARITFLEWLRDYVDKNGGAAGNLRHALAREVWILRNPQAGRLRMSVSSARSRLKDMFRKVTPGPLRSVARRLRRSANSWPPRQLLRFGSLRRVKPISSNWGFDRGLPVDRHYIEMFLAAHAGDIQGRVLEIKDDNYTRKFGAGRVRQSDVLHIEPGNPQATIVADLTDAAHIPSQTFDCVILTQTLNLVFDLSAAIATVQRILRPGGVVLATVPGISKISKYDMDRWGYYWSFTSKSARRLFEKHFGVGNVAVQAHGNVLTAVAFLHGLSAEELTARELAYHDPDYEALITVRAVKSLATQ